MMSYNLGHPMRWEEFTAMPHDIQQEYLDKLSELGGMLGSLCDMFGRSVPTVCKFFKVHDLNFRSRGRLGDTEEFLAFVLGEPKGEKEERVAEPRKATVELTSGSITLVGDVPDIASKLVEWLGVGKFKIRVEFEREE